MTRPRPPYLHPDGTHVSIGFDDQPATLLQVPPGGRDQAEAWCRIVGVIVRTVVDGLDD